MIQLPPMDKRCPADAPEPLQMRPALKLIMIVPAYNEEKTVGKTIRALKDLRAQLRAQNIEARVYVINDGSTDATAALSLKAAADRVVNHRRHRGLGAAVRTGLRAARRDGADLAVKLDADLQHDPKDIFEIIKPVLTGEADLVYGSRFDRITYRMPLLRKAGNRFFTLLMRRLTGWPLRDSQPGIFAAGRAYLNIFCLPGHYNYTHQILLDAFHKGMRFAHVDVAFHKRLAGESYISLSYPFKALSQIFRMEARFKQANGPGAEWIARFTSPKR